jgi:hypothetical protein
VPHFLDTNILLYAISPDPEEAHKRTLADALLNREDGALSVQVLQEFYVQATRPTRVGRLPHDLAAGLVHAWHGSGCRRRAYPSSGRRWKSRLRMAFLIGILQSSPRRERLVVANYIPRI